MAKPNPATKQHVSPPADMDQDEQEQLSIMYACLKTIWHYFGGLDSCFHPIHDPRNPDLTTYSVGTSLLDGRYYLARQRCVRYNGITVY